MREEKKSMVMFEAREEEKRKKITEDKDARKRAEM